MGEERKIERELMSQEEFENYIYSNSGLKTFEAVNKYKSVFRAIKRGHALNNGLVIPKRPFNNRANTSPRKDICSRVTNKLRKIVYGEIKQYQRATE